MEENKNTTTLSEIKNGECNGAFTDADNDKDFTMQTTKEPAVVGENADELDDDNLPCKWGPLNLGCCQFFRSPKLLLFFLCCSSCVQGMAVNGFVSVIISSVEKRFDVKSADTGLIASSYDIASLICLLPVTYFGGIGVKSRWLGWGIIWMGLGSFIFSLPHFTTELYEYDSSADREFCDVSANSSYICQPQSSLWRYKYVLILGQLMHGSGAAPLYTLGITYLDENLTQKMSSVYVGIFYAMSIIGPALGYVIGGYLLTFYTDFDQVSADSVLITEDSVAWVGAWWLGFLLSGGLALIIGTFLLGFPKYLPNTAKIRAEKISEAYGGAKAIETKETGLKILKDFPKYLKVIVLNPTFIFLSLGGASEALVVSGFVTFVPKYVESQFSQSASFSALLVGALTIPTGGIGTFLGGYFVKRFDLSLPGTIRMCIVTCVIVIFISIGFVVRCNDVPFAGVTSGYNSSTVPDVKELVGSCNSECSCLFERFDPVCGANQLMYFSSCAAGCTNVTDNDGTKTYFNCTCVESYLQPSVNPDFLTSATEGKCDAMCSLLPLFLVILGLTTFFTMMTIMPGLSATLRSVPDKQRSFALGIQWVIIRTLGSIPGPVAFGAVIDLACVFWLSTESCDANVQTDDKGTCYFYDNVTLSNNLLAMSLGFKTLSAIFYFLAWITYRAPPSKVGTDNATPGKDIGINTTNSTTEVLKKQKENKDNTEKTGQYSDSNTVNTGFENNAIDVRL